MGHVIGKSYKLVELIHPANLDKVTFQVVERHEGNRTTDFGAHDIILDSDQDPVDQQDLQFWQKLLNGSWTAFDQAVENARGKDLRKGPRGGGRDLEKIMGHILGGDQAYLRRLAWKVKKWDGDNLLEEIKKTRLMILQALDFSCKSGIARERTERRENLACAFLHPQSGLAYPGPRLGN